MSIFGKPEHRDARGARTASGGKFGSTESRPTGRFLGSFHSHAEVGFARAFTLMEVMCTLVLVLLLVIAAISAITFLSQSSGRVADYAAAMAVVSGKMEAIRAASYKPPNSPFTASTVLLTNSARIALAKNGTNFLVSGSVVSIIKPMAGGHLVTVTGTFKTPQRPLSVSLQTLVNRFTGGDE